MADDPATALEAANRRIADLEAEVQRLSDAAEHATAAKDAFLANLSHELRTPLNAMLGWIQLLRLHMHDAAERMHAIDVLERNTRAQVQIVNDLLDVSRVITGNMRLSCERVDLADVVRRAVASLAHAASAKGVELQVDLDDRGRMMYGDATRLQQVVWNLVSNGVKFTQSGGQVHVSLRAREAGVELEVRDTGIGIPADLVPYVFERFHQGDSSLTRPYGGLGLGLALVRHLVELHGGTVHVSSEGSGRGATFLVRLPTQAPDNDEAACKLLSKSV
jgi:signal transduction histidine kinase